MTSIAYVENETPEQRQVRIAQALEGHARREAAMRAEEAARIRAAEKGPPPPKAPPTNPFTDPNYALRQLNEYFGSLRKDYGEGAIRGAGFTPRDLSLMQASLRKLQMDPRATPEQHQQAYQQARDALAQRITTPLAAARPTPSAPVEVEVRGVMPSMPETVMPEMPPMPVTPPPPMRLYVDPEPPVPSATDYISSMVTQQPPAELLMPPVGSPALLGDAPRPLDPSMVQPTAPGILPGIMPMQPSMNTQPGADFDRNVGRQIFDAEFRTLREKYGDDGLRAAGFTPRTLSALQAPLTNVQKDNTISYDQSSAALENALQQLRGYNFGGAQPAAPMQPAAPAPLPGYYRGGPVMRYR